MPDYYEDLKVSIAQWVHLHLEVVEPVAIHQPQAVSAALSHAARMQIVYTKHVIPDELLQLWHSSAHEKLQTVAKHGQDHAEIYSAWADLVVIKLLRVDTHPTLSRFFSFRGAVDRMLTMSLLNFPATGGFSTKLIAREEGLKRVKRVRHFFC